jgi:trimeric autotransporter adhesin
MKKIYNVMASAAVVASLAIPVSAFASSSYTTPTGVTATQPNTTITTQTRVAVKIDPGSLTATNGTVIVRLPADAYGVATASAPTTVGNSNNAVTPGPQSLVQNSATADPNIAHTGAYREYTLHVTPNVGGTGTSAYDYSNNDGLVYIDFSTIYVPSVSDNLNLTFDAQNGSAFTSGTVTVAQISTGKVDVTVDDSASITQSGDKISTIRVKEDQKGAFAHDSGNNILKVKLPNGLTWHNLTGSTTIPVVPAGGTAPTSGPYIQQIWGAGEWASTAPVGTTNGSANVSVSTDGRQISIVSSGNTTLTPNYFAISGLSVDVDSTVAKTGEVDATLGGDSTLNESDLVLGTYGELGATATIANPVNEKAGRSADNDLNSGFLTIQENAANSLIDQRTIKLTLGGNAKWSTDSNNQPIGPVVDSAASDLQGVSSSVTWNWVGTDKTTIEAKLSVNHESKPAKIVFKKGDLDVAADAADQDVTMTLAGTQGITATGTIAKIVSPVKVSVNGDTPNLKIGVQGQALSPIDITEAVAGALDNGASNNQVTLTFPLGVTVHNPESVSVTSGDLVLADASNISTGTDANGHGYLTFNIKSTSSTASTVEVKGLVADVNRMVSEGALKVDLAGSALNEDGGTPTSVFPNVTKVGSYTVANVVTPAPGETTANAKFTIGQTTYTVNGVQKTLDVAPYTQNGRTYLPIRFVAEALGISDDNIVWNDATKTVTLINGNRIASFKVGQSSYTVNGAVVPMDAAAQFKDNRNMIPLRYAAQALGVAIGWDDATQTVTVGSAVQQ